MRLVLVVVSGPPGAGKTTLAARLGAEVGLPVFDRDDLKDAMFEVLGWSDREWSMKVGRASYVLLYSIIELLAQAGVSLIAETNFRNPDGGDSLRSIVAATGASLIEIHCSAAPDVLLRRFRERWESGGRHPGHVAGHFDLDRAETGEQFASGHPPLAIGDVLLEVDTTDPEKIDWDAITTHVRRALGENAWI